MSTQPLPLDGVTVVAVEQAVSAPFATRQLADLGARVIKIERPDGGDFARDYDTAAHGLASHFVWCNYGKESIAVDLKDPRGLEIAQRLVADADVFVQNLAQGAAARLGLDAATLCAAHPGWSPWTSRVTAPKARTPTNGPTTCSCSARPAWSPSPGPPSGR